MLVYDVSHMQYNGAVFILLIQLLCKLYSVLMLS